LNQNLISTEREKLEKDYLKLIESLKPIVTQIREKKKNNALLYWKFGEIISEFLNSNSIRIVFLENLREYFERDLGVSGGFIWRCRKFVLSYPDVSKIDPNKNFNVYRDTFEQKNRKAKKSMR
jgi:hypothetical protein